MYMKYSLYVLITNYKKLTTSINVFKIIERLLKNFNYFIICIMNEIRRID